MVKSVDHPIHNKLFFGRKRPVVRHPALRLSNYLTRQLPGTPVVCDYSARAAASLSNIYLNDQLGDCVIACMAHSEGVLTGNAGVLPLTFTSDQITTLYSAIGGYVPGNPATDNGCDIQTALAYWQNNGLIKGSARIAGWLAVNPLDEIEMRAAVWLFENLVFGLDLPDAWVNSPVNPGFTWDTAGNPDPANGHCIVGVGSNLSGIRVDTWGMLGTLTYAAISAYVTASAGGELYTVISQDGIDKAMGRLGKTPAGLDWSQLVADFDSIGGKVMV